MHKLRRMPTDPDRRLAVLRYRKVGPLTAEDWLTTTAVPPETFTEQIAALHHSDWDPVDADAFVAGLDDPEALPERAVLVTFDGAYRHLVDRASPVLRRYRVPAVAFVASGRVGETFSYDPESDRPEPVCSWDDLRGLQSMDVSVESMGETPRLLAGLPATQLEREIVGSKSTIESRLGTPVRLFAFPSGDPGTDPAAVAKVLRLAGYRAAFGTGGEAGPAPPADRFRVARITMSQGTDLAAELRGG